MVMGYNDDKPLKRTFKKRRLSRTGGDLPDFFSFPSSADQSTASQPFRVSVRSFLSRHAHLTLPPSLFPSLLTWRVALRLEDPDLSPSVVVLDVVEEDVTRSKRSVYCDHCRVVGESTHRLSSLLCVSTLFLTNSSRLNLFFSIFLKNIYQVFLFFSRFILFR